MNWPRQRTRRGREETRREERDAERAATGTRRRLGGGDSPILDSRREEAKGGQRCHSDRQRAGSRVRHEIVRQPGQRRRWARPRPRTKMGQSRIRETHQHGSMADANERQEEGGNTGGGDKQPEDAGIRVYDHKLFERRS
jgi:hypothetical protein